MLKNASHAMSVANAGRGGGLMQSLKNSGHMDKDAPLALEDKKTDDVPVVSRVQIQRMIDEDDHLADLLNTHKAVEVIRRFKVARDPDPYDEISRLQQNVIKKLDGLDNEGLKLRFEEVESLKIVS